MAMNLVFIVNYRNHKKAQGFLFDLSRRQTGEALEPRFWMLEGQGERAPRSRYPLARELRWRRDQPTAKRNRWLARVATRSQHNPLG
jgi:hypothetical protein